MIIMKYANGGNLHDYLQRNFTNITWEKKLYILWRISDGYLYFNVLIIKLFKLLYNIDSITIFYF